jgi:hypothetical protein
MKMEAIGHSEALVNGYQLLHSVTVQKQLPVCYVYFYGCIDYMELNERITANDVEETRQDLRVLFYYLTLGL